MSRFLASLLLLVAWGARAGAAEFHVSPSGSAAGNGSPGSPWDLATALGHPAGVQPGDTIWLRHGVHRGPVDSRLAGTAEAPIVVRQAPGERAVIDGGCSGSPVLLVSGQHVWFWGFEVLNSDPHRVTRERGSWPAIPRGIGVYTREAEGGGTGVRFINLIVHDTSGGFGVWKEAVGAEVYGSLVYYNGWDAPDRGHGHGIYAQNESGTMRLVDNVLFDQLSHGIHAYGSSAASLDGLHVEGNIAFNNGRPSITTGNARNILVGGGSVAEDPVVIDNVTYYPFGTSGENNFGLFAGTRNLVATGNTFVGDLTLWMIPEPTATLAGNTLIGDVHRFAPTDYPANTYLPPASPGGTSVFVRPNAYEPGRANVAVLNWERSPAVAVDLSGVLAPGDAYEIRDAQNFFAPPVAAGTFDGSPIDVPMAPSAVARPIGSLPVAPVHTGPEFGAFVVLRPTAPLGTCGDGVVDPGESCDDGGILDGDGCSGTCQSESRCGVVPATGCRRAGSPNRSSLLVTRQGGARDTFVWRWQRGAATSPEEFGDPLAGTRYEVCVYDGGSNLVQRIAIPAENACTPGWRATRATRRFASDDQLPDGTLKASLTAGAVDGRTQIAITGRGSFLGTIPLPAALPLRVQLRQSGSGPCWEAELGSARQNGPLRLRASGS